MFSTAVLGGGYGLAKPNPASDPRVIPATHGIQRRRRGRLLWPRFLVGWVGVMLSFEACGFALACLMLWTF